MAMDFPNSPTVNQTFTVGDKTWKWTGTVWEIVVNRPATRTVADTAPTSPIVGDEWFNSLTGRTYTWFDSYWVEVNTNSMVGASGLNGVASASAPLVYNNTNNNISVQTNPTFSGTTTANGVGSNAAALIANAGRLRVVGSSGDVSGVLELVSNDGVYNYIYKANGGGITFSNPTNTVLFYNTSGHRTEPLQPVWNSDIASSTNNYATFGVALNVGFTATNNYTITVQTAGKYFVRAQQLMQTAGAGYWQLRKNNVTQRHAYASGASFMDYGVEATMDMAAGDTIQLVATMSLTNSWNGAHSNLDIIKVA